MVADTEKKVLTKTKKPTLEDFKARVLAATEQAERDKTLALWPEVEIDIEAARIRIFNSPHCWNKI